MGVRVMEDRLSGEACIYCSTSGWAFGPVWESAEEAQRFLDWLKPTDPRSLSESALGDRASAFRMLPERTCQWCLTTFRYDATKGVPEHACSEHCWDNLIDLGETEEAHVS